MNKSNKCVYNKSCGKSRVILCLFVDDILIFGTNIKVVKATQKFLSLSFEMKDLKKSV